MKKLFLLAAAICAAVGINAAVIELDLSKASQYATAGSATLNYANGELTVDWTVTEAWEVSGIEIPLKSVKGIVGIQYEYAGDGSAHSFLHYLRDLQGNFWWDPNGWFNFESTSWQSASVTPSTALWSTPGYEYGLSPMLALCFVANPETPTSGTFKLRNVKIITSGEGGNDSIPDGQSLPLTYNGEILPINTEFERSMTGTLSESLLLPEISGIACSRVTPGYIWMQGDETDRDTNPFIIATDETGSKLAAKVRSIVGTGKICAAVCIMILIIFSSVVLVITTIPTENIASFISKSRLSPLKARMYRLRLLVSNLLIRMVRNITARH